MNCSLPSRDPAFTVRVLERISPQRTRRTQRRGSIFLCDLCALCGESIDIYTPIIELASMPPFILGSASPRRAALLRELGVEFVVRPSGAAEVAAAGESAEDFARRIAREKGAAVAAEHRAWVLSADTVVVVDGMVLGKPVDAEIGRASCRERG